MKKLPPAKEARGNPGGRGAKIVRPGDGAAHPATIAEQVGSENRGLRLKKLDSQPKPVVRAAVEKLTGKGKDITVNAVLKEMAAEETAQRREASRTAQPLTSMACLKLR